MPVVRLGSPQVVVRCRLRRVSLRGRLLERLVQRILQATGESRAELGLELIGDRRMRRLNRQYRGIDHPTDVLAFPMRNWLSVLRDASPGPIALQNAMGAPPHVLLGDVVISLDTAARQAATDRQPIDQAVVRLLIHGILHLCGYDHERAREARRMRAKERAIFRLLRPIPKLVKR